MEIPADLPEGACHLRAHMWVALLRERNVNARKAFMVGRLETMSKYALGATVDTPRKVKWSYHVAPVVSVDLGNGGLPLEMVLDPSMGKGILPMRTWIKEARITRGFAEEDLYFAKPLPPGAKSELAPGEVQVFITDPHVVALWKSGVQPPVATFEEASELVAKWTKAMPQFNFEVALRREFRNWHESLPAIARQRFNELNSRLEDAKLRDFHDWFRALGQEARTEFAARLDAVVPTVFDLVPSWADRVWSARHHSATIDVVSYYDAQSKAASIVATHCSALLADAAQSQLIEEIKDVVAFRVYTEGEARAIQLAQRLAIEFGTSA